MICGLALGVAATAGLEVVGIDYARDRVVSIDLDSDERRPLLQGRGLRPSAIHWAPDGSFAYLVVSDGLLIYDPAVEDVVGRIDIKGPGRVSFSSARPRAFVGDVSGFKVLDTEIHAVIDGNSFRRVRAPWTFSSSGRWAGAGGVVVAVDEPETEYWFDGGARCRAQPMAGAADRFYLPCSEYVAVVDAAAAREVGRVYLNGRVQAMVLLPGGEKALAVTDTGLSVVDLQGLYVSQVIALPFYLGAYSYREVAFSRDGGLLFHQNYGELVAYNTTDMTVVWTHGDRETLFLSEEAVAAGGTYPFREEVWREQDRSFYSVSLAGLERLSVDDGNAVPILRDFNFTHLVAPRSGSPLFAVSGGDGVLRRIDSDSDDVVEFAVPDEVQGRELVAASAGADGDDLVVATKEYSSYLVGSLGRDTARLVGEVVSIEASRPSGPYLRELEILALSGQRALFWGERGSWHGFIDFVSGTVSREGSVDVAGASGILAAVAEPDGDGAYLGLDLAEDSGQRRRPLLVYAAPDEEREVWRGPFGMSPSALAVSPRGQTVYVALDGVLSSRSYVAEIDAAGEQVGEIPLAAAVRDLAISRDGRWLVASLHDAPHLVVIDTTERRVVGAVGDAPDLMSMVLFEDGADLNTDALVPYATPPSEPPAPDVLVYTDSWSYLDDSLVIARHGATQRISMPGYPERLWSTSVGVAYVETRGERGRVLHELDLTTGRLLWSMVTGQPPEGSVSLDLDLPFQGLAVASDASVAFAVNMEWAGDQPVVLVSVIDLDARDVAHSVAVAGVDPYRSALSPDGAFLYLGTQDGRMLFFDTTDSGSMALEADGGGVVLTNKGSAFYTGPRSQPTVWRIALLPGAEPERVAGFGGDGGWAAVRLYDSADGSSVIVDVFDPIDRDHHMVVLDAEGEVRLRLDLPPDLYDLTTSLDGERLYASAEGVVRVFDIRDGALLARIAVERTANAMIVGCAQPDCPIPLPPPAGVPWRARGTVTPTLRRTPAPTPSPSPAPPPPLRHDWFAIDRVAGRPGDSVEVAVRFRSSVYQRWEGGLGLDLLFPKVVEIARWLDGSPDCSRSTENHAETQARFEWIPNGCERGACAGVRAVAATEGWDVSGDAVMYSCRVRVSDGAPPGEYPIPSENLLVDGWVTEYRPAVTAGALLVVASAEGYPSPPGRAGEPDPGPPDAGVVRLRGGQAGASPGETVGLGFVLEGSRLLPSGGFEAVVEIPAELSLISGAPGVAPCSVGSGRAGAVELEKVEVACAGGICDGLRVSFELQEFEEYRSESEVLDALTDRRKPIFSCHFEVAADSRCGDALLPLRRATLDGQPLATVPGVVLIRVPEAESSTLRHDWFEIDRVAGRPGDTVDVAVRYRSSDCQDWRGGLDHDLLFPEVVEISRWQDGTPDCSRSNETRHETWARFESIPGGCGLGDCSGVRAVAVTESDVLRGSVMYRCRVRIRDDASPGEYAIRSENLLVEGWDADFAPAVVDGELLVVPAASELPDRPGGAGEPAPEPLGARAIRLRGSQTGAAPGENIGIGFSLGGSAVLLSGAFAAVVEIPPGLALSPEEFGREYCGVGSRRARSVEFETVEVACASGVCDGLRVSLDLPEPDRHRSEQEALEALFYRRYPLFECRYEVSSESRPGDLLLSLQSATLDGDSLAKVPGVVRVHVPVVVPTPTATGMATLPPTATPTFLQVPRQCEAEELGVSMLCIEDLEADPGGTTELVVHYRSGGLAAR